MLARHSVASRSGVSVLKVVAGLLILAVLLLFGLFELTRKMHHGHMHIQGRIMNEISSLGSAIECLNGSTGVYPPCMGAIAHAEDDSKITDRSQQMDSYLKKRFPRSPLRWKDLSDPATGLLAGKPTPNFEHSFRNWRTGKIGYLDINTLDQAEALVFWLACFPMPVDDKGEPLAPRKLIGFNSHPTDPFSLNLAENNPRNPAAFLKNRTSPLYQFDDSRLVDADADGWLEYILLTPGRKDSPDAVPPYVYFDASLYTQWTTLDACNLVCYPAIGGVLPVTTANHSACASLISKWGVAMPYASTVSGTAASSTITWQNPTSFQIVCAGEDLRYAPLGWTSTASYPYLSVLQGNPNAGIAPGTTFVQGTPTELSAEQNDNLTNFWSGIIYEMIQAAGS
jgi:hypothetical protein